MSAQPGIHVTGPAGVTDLTVIEGINLNAEVRCDGLEHDHPADLIAAATCPTHGGVTVQVCHELWDWLYSIEDEMRHTISTCRRDIVPGSLRIVEVLR